MEYQNTHAYHEYKETSSEISMLEIKNTILKR